jgi:hypothetical protein
MENIILIALLGVILGGAAGYVYKSKKKGVKCIGCWKVYGNEAEAKRKFDNFQKCTSFYCRKVKEGHTLAQLVI